MAATGPYGATNLGVAYASLMGSVGLGRSFLAK